MILVVFSVFLLWLYWDDTYDLQWTVKIFFQDRSWLGPSWKCTTCVKWMTRIKNDLRRWQPVSHQNVNARDVRPSHAEFGNDMNIIPNSNYSKPLDLSGGEWCGSNHHHHHFGKKNIRNIKINAIWLSRFILRLIYFFVLIGMSISSAKCMQGWQQKQM